jgi:phosphoserine phosphatase
MPSSGTYPAFKQTRAAILDQIGCMLKRAIFDDVTEHLTQVKLMPLPAQFSVQSYAGAYGAGQMGYESMTAGQLTSFYQGLHGMLVGDVENEIQKFLSNRTRNYFFKKTRELFDKMACFYERTVAITGVPDELMKAVQKYTPYKTVIASRCNVVDGRYDSIYSEEEIRDGVPEKAQKIHPLVGSLEKIRAVERLDMKEPIYWPKSSAWGNSEQDLLILRRVPYPLLFNISTDSEMSKIADHNKWETVDADSDDPERNILVVERSLKKLGLTG